MNLLSEGVESNLVSASARNGINVFQPYVALTGAREGAEDQ